MNKKDIQTAYILWYRYYNSQIVDHEVAPYLTKEIQPFKEGCGWLRRAREALFLSTGHVAEKLGISRQAYAKAEKNEQSGQITLNTLSKIAEGLDCELVYAIRPKKKLHFSEIIWNSLVTASINHSLVKHPLQKRRAQALAEVARINMGTYKFRVSQGWSKR